MPQSARTGQATENVSGSSGAAYRHWKHAVDDVEMELQRLVDGCCTGGGPVGGHGSSLLLGEGEGGGGSGGALEWVTRGNEGNEGWGGHLDTVRADVDKRGGGAMLCWMPPQAMLTTALVRGGAC